MMDMQEPGPAGLTGEEAARRLRQDGPNELPQERGRGPLRIVFDALKEPMLQLLLAAGLIYLLVGDLAEALILLAFAVLNVALVAVQEGRTERALAAMRELASPHVTVVRDGNHVRITSRELVASDLLLVEEGDRVAADAVLLDAKHIEADESLLTGESVPVRKQVVASDGLDRRPGGDASPFLWSGSLVVAGSGLARVAATGPRSEIGRIGASLASVEAAPSPLQVQTRRLVRVFATLGILSSVLLSVVYGVLHGDLIKAVLAGITLAMATLPEELPLVLTIFLVLGAWRISKHHVLARRTAAVEALGAATVLCTDKTGTLTLNRMTVARLATEAGDTLTVAPELAALPKTFHPLLEFAMLASRPDPFDPMERAFQALGQHLLAQTEHLHGDWVLVHDYKLEPGLLAMSQVWRSKAGSGFVVAAKGAPKAVADLCHLAPIRLEALRRTVASMADAGLRVLAVARARLPGPAWPAVQHDLTFELVGAVGLEDPLRPGVSDAVKACFDAGIRVVMITGDHPSTAAAIAAHADIPTESVLSGQQVAAMDDAALRDAIAGTCVFARMMPEQKLRLVHAFAARGEVVVMTGDGVNDAPSLKAAHIGVAMGGRGTDVAREAASLVLLDDDFTSLVTAVRLGRRIDDNLRKAVGYVMAVHVPIAGMSLIPVLFGWPLLLGPIHVVFLELIIDPVSSIVFEAEPEEPGLMRRPPRSPQAPLFDRWLLARGIVQGAVVLAAALGSFLLGIGDAHGEEVSRAMAFVTLVLGNLGLVLTHRSISMSVFRTLLLPNRALFAVVTVTGLALGLALGLPALRSLFGFAPLSLGQIAEAAGAALASLLVNDLLGRLRGRSSRKGQRAPAAKLS